MGHAPIAAINTACHCSLAVFILLMVGLVLLAGLRAWLRRDKTVHDARLGAAFDDLFTAGDRADSQAADALRQLTPTADVARDWRRFVDGFVAAMHGQDSPGPGPDPGRKAERKGQAAETRLGIDCRVY